MYDMNLFTPQDMAKCSLVLRQLALFSLQTNNLTTDAPCKNRCVRKILSVQIENLKSDAPYNSKRGRRARSYLQALIFF